VQDAAANVLKADKADSAAVVARTLQLHNLNALELATSLNAGFASQATPLKAVADRRTNSIIVTGPEDKVLDVMINVIGMESSRGRVVPANDSPPASSQPAAVDQPPASQPKQ
jgi:hypothetical protein